MKNHIQNNLGHAEEHSNSTEGVAVFIEKGVPHNFIVQISEIHKHGATLESEIKFDKGQVIGLIFGGVNPKQFDLPAITSDQPHSSVRLKTQAKIIEAHPHPLDNKLFIHKVRISGNIRILGKNDSLVQPQV